VFETFVERGNQAKGLLLALPDAIIVIKGMI
jgi:hypothetical protein